LGPALYRVNALTTSNRLTFQAPVATRSAWRNRQTQLSNPQRTLVPPSPGASKSAGIGRPQSNFPKFNRQATHNYCGNLPSRTAQTVRQFNRLGSRAASRLWQRGERSFFRAAGAVLNGMDPSAFL